ncbi:hypothetical protein QOZ80_5BG0410060 [Eleusine coracana subsp. coracana]|nr:hypothetical protein QOZ80_5BG0410060 [Eleusine coracana subsp. coracana]
MQMQVLRLLAVSTITAAHSDEASDQVEEEEEDEGPFFDLDLASSSSSSSSSSSDESCCSELLDDFIISLHRSRSASPSYQHQHQHQGRPGPAQPPPLGLFCASEPSTKLLQPRRSMTSNNLRTLSFGGRPSFASSTRSLKLFMELELELESPVDENDDDEDHSVSQTTNIKSGAVIIWRYLTSISRRLRRTVRPLPRPAAAGDAIHRRPLRKSRSPSAAVITLQPSSRRDDSLVEKQDGIASAIAHCKESFRRASLSEFDSSLLRSRSDPGKC